MLSKHEIDRYKKQLNIIDWNISTQEILKKSTVFIAGAGGLGSPVLYYLAAAGVGHIKISDYDRIDVSNLNRQILYNIEECGLLKAETAKKKLLLLNDNIKITDINSNAGWELYDEIKDCDIIVDCVDNYDTRHTLNRISIQTGIPMIHAGVSEYYGQVTFLHPGLTPCLACFISEEINNDPAGVVGAMAGIIGSIQAMEVIKYLTGKGELIKNRLLYVDAKTMNFSTIILKKNPECKVCSIKKEVCDV